MTILIEKLKSFIPSGWRFDVSRKHGEGHLVADEEHRVVICHKHKDENEKEDLNGVFHNSNYSGLNMHLANSPNEKYNTPNIAAVMPNPAGVTNSSSENKSSSKEEIAVESKTSLRKRFTKRRGSRTNMGRGPSAR